MMNADKAWFGPRRRLNSSGIGATPTSWPGWVATGMFVIAEVGVGQLLRTRTDQLTSLLAHLGILAIFLVVVALTSSPDTWKWRSGK